MPPWLAAFEALAAWLQRHSPNSCAFVHAELPYEPAPDPCDHPYPQAAAARRLLRLAEALLFFAANAVEVLMAPAKDFTLVAR